MARHASVPIWPRTSPLVAHRACPKGFTDTTTQRALYVSLWGKAGGCGWRGRPIFVCMGGSRRRDVATPWFRCPGASARHPERVEVQPRGSGRACGVGGAGTMPIACTWRGLLGERHVPIGPISRSASAEPPSISPSSQPRRCAPGGPGRRGRAFIRRGSDSRARGKFREIDMTCKIDPISTSSPGGGGGQSVGGCAGGGELRNAVLRASLL